MIWFPEILIHEVDLRDDGFYDPRLCSFRFTGDRCSLEDRAAMIAWVTISLQVIAVDFETATSTHL
jgi:hypothetical protein